MALTPDEQATLDALTKKMSEPDADDFEVEIFSGDKGARLPLKAAANWLHKEFGIGEAPAAPAGAKPGDDGKTGDDDGGKKPASLFRPRGTGTAGR